MAWCCRPAGHGGSDSGDGSTWQDAADTCSPLSTYFLDTAENVMQVEICHLTEWNIQGPDMFAWKVYLPTVVRNY